MQASGENRSKKNTFAVPDHILVATDLTDLEYLVDHAIAQASSSGARATLVHAASDLLPLDGAAAPYIDEEKIVGEIRLTLLNVARQMETNGITCDIVVRRGNPSEVILEELGRSGATRLILGTNARGKFGQVVIGSVAHELLAKVNVPVFVVGPGARDAGQHVTPRIILHPVSLLGHYQESLQLAFEIAQSYGADLVLHHVLDRNTEESINPERTMEWARNALGTLVANAPYATPPIHTSVTYGDPAQEIARAAAFTDADWIVLGANGERRFLLFNETIAYQVLSKVDCPVLTLRHEPYQVEDKKPEEVHFTSPQ